MTTFPQVTEKEISWDVELARFWDNIYIHFKMDRQGTYKFLKVNALRNGRSGAYGQKEGCLRFGQAKGHLKSILVTPMRNNFIIKNSVHICKWFCHYRCHTFSKLLQSATFSPLSSVRLFCVFAIVRFFFLHSSYHTGILQPPNLKIICIIKVYFLCAEVLWVLKKK